MKNRSTIIKWAAIVAVPFLVAFIRLPNGYFTAKPECHNRLGKDDVQAPISTTPVYQQEVIRLLATKQPDDFRYFFKTFLEEKGRTYLLVNCRNNEICFDARLLVEKWDKLAGMRRTNGLAYPEELYELEWRLEERQGKQEVVYQDMHYIID